MKDVNLTYEFFDGYQEILISRKVAEVIKKNVPDAEFTDLMVRLLLRKSSKITILQDLVVARIAAM